MYMGKHLYQNVYQCWLENRNSYLKVAIDEVKEKHSSNADEELRGSAETAQVHP